MKMRSLSIAIWNPPEVIQHGNYLRRKFNNDRTVSIYFLIVPLIIIWKKFQCTRLFVCYVKRNKWRRTKKMRISYFLRFFLCIFSIQFVHSKETNKKFNYQSNHLDKFKADKWSSSNQDQLVDQLSGVFKEANQLNIDLKNKIDIMTKQLNELNKSNAELKKSAYLNKPRFYSHFFDEYYKKKPDFTWTLNETLSTTSSIFNLTGYPFKAQAKLINRLNAKNVRVLDIQLSYKKLDANDTAALNLTLIPAVYYHVQDFDSNHMVTCYNYNYRQVLQYDVFNYNHSLIKANMILPPYHIDFHVEPLEVTQQGYSYDGILVWAIYDYHSKWELEANESMYSQNSPYFYTAAEGSRVQVQVRLHGFEENQLAQPTVAIQFLTGPYDATLDISFRHMTVVTFPHPTDPTKHLVKGKDWNYVNGARYFIHMGTKEEVDNYVDQEGTLYYQVRIVTPR